VGGRDVTPEATRAVVEEGGARQGLDRNLPGSPGGVKDGLAVLDDIVGTRWIW
jgi:molybdopterin biosynthesis enzyme MoaB